MGLEESYMVLFNIDVCRNGVNCIFGIIIFESTCCFPGMDLLQIYALCKNYLPEWICVYSACECVLCDGRRRRPSDVFLVVRCHSGRSITQHNARADKPPQERRPTAHTKDHSAAAATHPANKFMLAVMASGSLRACLRAPESRRRRRIAVVLGGEFAAHVRDNGTTRELWVCVCVCVGSTPCDCVTHAGGVRTLSAY